MVTSWENHWKNIGIIPINGGLNGTILEHNGGILPADHVCQQELVEGHIVPWCFQYFTVLNQ